MGRFGLLLILVPLFIQGITATSVNVNEGKLSNVTQLDALATIAGESYGDALLDLLNGTEGSWHPMAFWRFMILGAPPNNEGLNLTKEDELLSRNVSEMGGLSATKRSAVGVYNSSQHVEGVGNVSITAWSLVYSCLLYSSASTQCATLDPVFITHANKRPEYVSLFRGFFPGNNSTYFATSVSADLAKLQDQNETHKLQNCTYNSFQAARSLLSASYGLPGFVCYDSSSDLTIQRIFSNQHTLAEDIKSWPKVKTEECAAAPFFQVNYGSTMACAKRDDNYYYCITVWQSNCSYIGRINAMYESIINKTDSEACGVYSSKVYRNSGYTYVTSKWETTDGVDKDEFEKGQAMGDFCYMKIQNSEISHPVSCTDNNSSRCDPTYFSKNLLDATLKDTANSFLSGHVTQFNVKRGPSAGKTDAAALAIATFMGLLGMVGPFTRGELRLFRKFRKCFNCSTGSHSILRFFGCLGLCLLNMVLGCVVYAPIIAAMESQYERRLPFHTWAISATSESVNSYGAKLLFLTFVEGSSTYSDLFIWNLYIWSCVFALLITAAVTCYEFFSSDPAQVYKERRLNHQYFHRFNGP